MKTRIQEGAGWSLESSQLKSPKTPTGSLSPEKQSIYFQIERRAGGKMVTILGGLQLSTSNREQLAKDLKQACGSGGTIRDGKIELQGDQKESARAWLIKNGWRLR